MIKAGLGASALALALMTALAVHGYFNIPADAVIARHWDASGVADGFSPRDHVLIGGPLFALALSALFAAIPLIDPRRENVKSSTGLLLAGWIGVLALVLLGYGSIILGAVNGGESRLLGETQFYGFCLLLVIVGNFMAKSRSNFFLGVRTPWSLSSEHAWSVANRLGGWLFVAAGLASAIAGMVYGPERGYRVVIASALAAALASVVVSYFAWRGDPERKGG